VTPRRSKDEYVAPKEAAEMFAAAGHPITPRHVSRLYDAGHITGYRRRSGYRRIRIASIEQYIQANIEVVQQARQVVVDAFEAGLHVSHAASP
jgi:hypothetical protein